MHGQRKLSSLTVFKSSSPLFFTVHINMLKSEHGQVCKIKQHGLNCNDTALLCHFPVHEDNVVLQFSLL